MASSFPIGNPPRPPPGYIPAPPAATAAASAASPNHAPGTSPTSASSSLPGSIQNLQIGRNPVPSSAPPGPPPFVAGGSRPGPPPQSLPSRPQFPQSSAPSQEAQHPPFTRPPPAVPNGPPSIGLSGPRFPVPASSMAPYASPSPGSRPPPGRPPAGPPPIYVQPSAPAAAVPMAHSSVSGPPLGPPQSQPFMGGPPSQPYMGPPLPPPTSGAAPPFASPPMWQQLQQPRQGITPMPNMMQTPPQMFGAPPSSLTHPMPPVPPVIGNSPLSGSQSSTPSKIDPNHIPRPMFDSLGIIFETQQGNQANIPPPATSDFIVKDTGNCSPQLMTCTMNQPLALPKPSEEPIQVVDFGESGPLRCSHCKGYINPFMKFVDQGRRFICNLCGHNGETPRDYFCNLGPDGRRWDADERPELCRGTVEFVATKEYTVRDPMPAVFFFLVDVSMNAIRTGATAATCSAITQAITDFPEGPRTMAGLQLLILLFISTI